MTKHIEFLIEYYTKKIQKAEEDMKTLATRQTRRRIRNQMGLYKEFVAEMKEVVKGEADNSGDAAKPERDDQHEQSQQVQVRRHKENCYSNRCAGCQ